MLRVLDARSEANASRTSPLKGRGNQTKEIGEGRLLARAGGLCGVAPRRGFSRQPAYFFWKRAVCAPTRMPRRNQR